MGFTPGTSRQTTRARQTREFGPLEHDVRQSWGAMAALRDVLGHDRLNQLDVLRRLELIRCESGWMLRLSAGCSFDGLTPVDVGEVVEATWRVLPGRVIARCVWSGGRVPMSLSHPVRLGRVVRNLLDNAIRTVGPDRGLEVRVRSHGSRIMVQVGGSGPGFGPIPRVRGRGLLTGRQVVAPHDGRRVVGRDVLGDVLGGTGVTSGLPVAAPAASAVGEVVTCGS